MQIAFTPLEFRGPLHEFHRPVGSLGNRPNIAFALDGEASDRLAGSGDAFGNSLCPTRLDPNHHGSSHIGIASSPCHRPKEQFQILSKLQAPVTVRQSHGALNVVGHGLARGIRDIVNGEDNDMVANADPSVLSTVCKDLSRFHN
jgi:hypothetical protein